MYIGRRVSAVLTFSVWPATYWLCLYGAPYRARVVLTLSRIALPANSLAVLGLPLSIIPVGSSAKFKYY